MAPDRKTKLRKARPRRRAIESTCTKSALRLVVPVLTISLSFPAHAQTDSRGFLPVSLQCDAGESVRVLYQDPGGRRLRYEVAYSADEPKVARAFVAKSVQSQFNLAAKIDFRRETVPAYVALGREIVLKIAWAKYACSSVAERQRQQEIMARNRAVLSEP